MSYGNDPYEFDSSSDAEMFGYPSPPLSPSSPIESSVAWSALIAKPRRSSQKNKSNSRTDLRVSYVPAPSHLSAKEILEKHPNRLFYNNILKVALQYHNSQIEEKLPQLGYSKYIAYSRIVSATK